MTDEQKSNPHPLLESLVNAHQAYVRTKEQHHNKRSVMRVVGREFAIAMALEAKQEGAQSRGEEIAQSLRGTDPDLYRYYLDACKRLLNKTERSVLEATRPPETSIAK